MILVKVPEEINELKIIKITIVMNINLATKLMKLFAVFIVGYLIWFMIDTIFSPKTKLYKVTFTTGSVIVDSLQDYGNSLVNKKRNVHYPKTTIIKYQEIKNPK